MQAVRVVAGAVGLVAGIASQVLWPALPALPWLAAASVPALLAACCAPAASRQQEWASAVLGAALGLAWATVVAGSVLAARLPALLEGVDQTITGEVRSAHLHADGSATYQIVLPTLPWRPDAQGYWQVRLGSQEPLPLAVGERWQLPVRLKRPHAAQNPGAADFERYLFGERIVATGYLRVGSGLQRLAPAQGLAAWRGQLLAAALPLLGAGAGDLAVDDAGRFARAVLPALVLDERSLLGSAQWRVLANTGTAHLVAISGLHVALVWAAVFVLVMLCTRRRRVMLRYRPLPVLMALAVATGYAALAGMPLPAARATLMLAVVSILVLRDGAAPPWRVLLTATLVVLLGDPLAVHAAGFWLSHGAVAALLLLADLHRRRPERVAPAWFSPPGMLRAGGIAVRGQLLLSVLVAPLLLGLFGSSSVSTVLANLPAIPLVNLLVLPLALTGFALAPWLPVLANPCLDAAVALLALLWQFLVWLDGMPLLAPLTAHGMTAGGVLLLTVVVTALLLVRAWSLRLALLALLVLVWPVAPQLPPGQAEVCVLDVGQGLAVTARTAQHAVLYDAGPAWSAELDAGMTVVVPVLRAQGVRRLDLMVLSHNDLDHVGGADSVQAVLAPAAIIAGQSRPTMSGFCDRERHWRYDGVDLQLFPGAASGDDNDRSCVLRVAAGRHAILLPGDSSRRRELELTARYGDRLAADVLVAGHHGSRSSSSLTFLHRVQPRHVVFSAGYRNRFGHPHPTVLRAAGRLDARTHNTARDGALCLLLRPDAPPQPVAWRSRHRRFWRE